MSTRVYSIVCAVDLSETSPGVIEHALSEAHRHRNVGLHFMTIVEPRKGRFKRDEPGDADLKKADWTLRALVRESLPAFADDVEEDSQRELRFHTRVGQADEQIIELAMEARADRIVMGRHSNERHRKPLGGISGAVVNSAPCTVEIVQVADYGQVEDYDQCPLCVQVRSQSGGNTWFCPEHSTGRIPRLTDSVGISSPTPGWGIF
jgi:nucleotide-binding universal stress UspA family protein